MKVGEVAILAWQKIYAHDSLIIGVITLPGGSRDKVLPVKYIRPLSWNEFQKHQLASLMLISYTPCLAAVTYEGKTNTPKAI